jgi:alpha-amylase
MTLGGTPLACAAEAIPGGVAIRMWLARAGGAPLDLDKRVAVRGAVVDARYRLRATQGAPVSARWVVQWNLALTAGDAPGRPGRSRYRPSLGSSGRVLKASRLALVDEWIGVEARLDFRPDAEVAWGPVETVSLSESGFERIYQGTALVVVWPLELEPGGEQELSTALTVVSR